MDTQDGENYAELVQAQTLIQNQVLSNSISLALKCAIELGIADHIHAYGRPMPLFDLARAIPIPPEKDAMLRRLMRLLISNGVFSAKTDAIYHLTPVSRLLLTDGPNMGAFALAIRAVEVEAAWYYMSKWFKTTGSTPCEIATGGKTIWDIFIENPSLNALFNEAMSGITKQVVKSMILERPEVFRGVKSLIDVGGGNGTAVKLIAEAFPDIKCTVFDLPHVIPTTTCEGFDAVGGNMFEYIPPANAVLLKNVLHDWSDEDCAKILKRCKEVIPPKEAGGKVMIVEIVINSHEGNPKVAETHLFYDLAVMTANGGQEREEEEWAKLFKEAGFGGDYKIISMLGLYSIIELYP